jgi:hypothetical protein
MKAGQCHVSLPKLHSCPFKKKKKRGKLYVFANTTQRPEEEKTTRSAAGS